MANKETPKGSNEFKEAIKNHLRNLAKQDSLFLKTLKKENKNINDCITYILNHVKSSGAIGFPDSEIYQMAVHYYDEDNIEVGIPISDVHIANNKAIQLTEEEIKAAKNKASEKIIQEEMNRLKAKPKEKKEADNKKDSQSTLF